MAFFAGNVLQRVPVSGGAPLRVCDVPAVSAGGSWGPNDTIVFAVEGGLFRVAASGGTPVGLEATDGARWPDFLPDRKTVLFTRGDGIYTTSLEGGAVRTIARINSRTPGDGAAVLGEGSIAQARFLPTGHLVYGQDPGAVRAVSFDESSLRLKGSPVSLVDGVYRASSGSSVYFAVSMSGLLVYAPENQRRSLAWVDRAGRATPIGSDREPFRDPRLSPDGNRIAVAIDDANAACGYLDLRRGIGTRTRLTSSKTNLAIVWTPDGRR